jgi:hypothetical protein
VLDGLEQEPDGSLLVSDWAQSVVHRVSPDGDTAQVLVVSGNTADFTLVPNAGLLIVPLLSKGIVKAYRWPFP